MGKITRLYHCCAAEDDTLQIEITEEGLLKFFLDGAVHSSAQYVNLDKEQVESLIFDLQESLELMDG